MYILRVETLHVISTEHEMLEVTNMYRGPYV